MSKAKKVAEVSALADCFFTRKDNEGKDFVTLHDDGPRWLLDAVREAHDGGSTLPSNWVYETCYAACSAIDDHRLIRDGESEVDHDDLHEFVDGEVDVYAQSLAQWYADMCLTSVYAAAESEAEDTEGEILSAIRALYSRLSGESTINNRLMAIQYCAVERIANIMCEAWLASKASDAS